MKTPAPFLLFALLFGLISCDTEEITMEDSNADLNATSLKSSGIIVIDDTPDDDNCAGYGFYENKQFDCGWYRGYSDWVYHYNWVVTSSGGSSEVECKKIRYITYDSNKKAFSSKSFTVDGSQAVIQQVQNIFWGYYVNLGNNQFKDDFSAGMYAGYQAGRGQVPYSALSEKCTDAIFKVTLPNLRYKKTKKGEEVGN